MFICMYVCIHLYTIGRFSEFTCKHTHTRRKTYTHIALDLYDIRWAHILHSNGYMFNKVHGLSIVK